MKPFSWKNEKHVITFGTLITVIISGTLALFFNIDALSHMISTGTLMSYSTVCLGVILLRYRNEPEPDGPSHSLHY